jgi:crotonobetainyl-CoA:carnitine CoA-transferase CaiB-like acyl-CoA transferase
MLAGVRVLAWGARGAVQACAVLLEHNGAMIVSVSPEDLPPDESFEVVIVSTDTSHVAQRSAIAELKQSGRSIVCDITAMGPQSWRGGCAWSDGEIQAMTGLMDTTGFPDGEPVRSGVPFTEISAAFYAAAAIAIAIRVARVHSIRQAIDVSLFGCAASGQTTFLPKAFVRGMAKRIGNRHAACAPWNSYRTVDGWVLICTSTDDQWARLKGIIDDPRLADARFDKLASRVRLVDELDPIIESWSSGLRLQECLTLCEGTGVPAGPIVEMDHLGIEPNFRLRHAAVAAQLERAPAVPSTYRGITVFCEYPLVESGRDCGSTVGEHMETPVHRLESALDSGRGPLSGIRVVEIGQYTTAPLAGKHLAALGAEVIKVEQPEGEVTRGWNPGQKGVSFFFALNNSDKRLVKLDLRRESDRIHLADLLASAHILVENLRPGTLAKLGFDRAALARINPRLTYCSISGFGVRSAYPDRPAFDTTIQSMAGFMDRTRSDGVPVKLGASAADILAGQAALLALSLALSAGEPQVGRFFEVAMQDVAAWCSLYAAGNPAPIGVRIACNDGFVWIDDARRTESLLPSLLSEYKDLTRREVVERLGENKIQSVPIVRIDELMDDPDFLSDVLCAGTDETGTFWPLLKLPYRLHRTPGRVISVPGIAAKADVERDIAK